MGLLGTLNSLVFGSHVGITVWFFFVQSPKLFSLLGRKRFVPIMMPLTQLYSGVALLLSLTGFLLNLSLLPGLGAGLVAINYFFIVPRALQAGRSSTAERAKEESHSVADFAVEGGSKTATKTLHQTVVFFVLAATATNLAHLFLSSTA
jgi:hypothetical protein